MKHSNVVLGALCVLGSFSLTSPAYSWILWKCCSELTGDAEFTGVPAGSTLQVKLLNPTIKVQCFNPNSNDEAYYSPGEGNAGDLVFPDVVLTDSDKVKGVVTALVGYPLDKWDDPDYEGFMNLCVPSKLPVTGSAHIESFNAEYWVLNKNGNPSLGGYQECTWTGEVDPITGLPTHDAPFDCPTGFEGKPNKIDLTY